jgi:hypothetical protein
MKLINNLFIVFFFITFTSLHIYPYAEFELEEDTQFIGNALSELLMKCRNESLSLFARAEKENLKIINTFYKETRKRTQATSMRYIEEETYLKYLPTIEQCDTKKNSCCAYAEDYFEAQDNEEKTLFYSLLVNTIKEIKTDLENSKKNLFNPPHQNNDTINLATELNKN